MNNEIYRLTVGVEVNGDKETKSKLTAMERMTEQTQKKMKALDKINVSPSAKLNDQASSKIDNVASKVDKLNNRTATTKIKAEDQASSTINKIGNSLDSMGDKISGVGNKLSMGITLPIVGLGIAAGKVGMDFDSSMSRVSAISEATGTEFKQLNDMALQLGADTAFSAKQASEGMENLASSGFNTTEIMAAMPGMLDLAASSGENLASSAEIASSTLRGFGLATDQAGHVADVLAKNASKTNAAVADTGEAMKYISPIAQTAGWSLESVAASIGELANSGQKGSQAGTILRATFSRLAKPSDESAKAMENMGFKAYDAEHKMKSLSTIVGDLQSSTANMTEEQKQNTIAQIFGEEAMSGILTLMKNGPQALDDLTQSYINSDGAAKKMAKTMQDNAKSAIEQMMGSLETAAIKLEETFAPKIREAANYVQDLANKFSALSPEQQDFYIKLALGAAALGPVTKLVGGLTSSIGGLMKVSGGVAKLFGGMALAETTLANGTIVASQGATGLIGAIAGMGPAGWAATAAVLALGVGVAGVVTYNDLMSKSVTTSTDDLNAWQKVVNKCTGSTIKSKAELVKAGVIYDDFGEGVSDSFKKAAQDSSTSLLKLEMNINRLTRDDILDDAENNQLKNWVNDMAYEGINAMKAKQSEIKSELSKTFSLDGVTSTAEQGTLDYMDKFFGEGVNKELEIRDQIYEIGNKAIKDHGAILDSDMKQIKDKLAELQAVKLEYANAESAGEKAYAQSKFKSVAERVTGVDGASTLLQERAKEHNSSIDETKAKYEETIANTQNHLNYDKNLSDTDKTNLQNTINETTAARDKALKDAEVSWNSDLSTLYQAYPKAKGMLNEDTGVRLSNAEITSQKTQSKIAAEHSGVSDITESGVYALTNNVTKELDTLYVSVDKKTGKIKGLLNSVGEGSVDSRTGAYSDAEKEKLMSLQEQYNETGSALQSLASDHAMLNTNTDEVLNSAGNLIGTLENVTIATDGSRTGILDLNGTPVQITADASGAISIMNDVDRKLKALDGTTVQARINLSTTFSQGAIDYGEQDGARFTKKGYATGTNNATAGVHPIAENGFEIVTRRQNRLFSGGEKVLTHEQSKSFLKNQQNTQGQFQLFQPQMQVAGAGGGINVNVPINLSANNNDADSIVQEVVQVVGYKLKEALTNIKK